MQSRQIVTPYKKVLLLCLLLLAPFWVGCGGPEQEEAAQEKTIEASKDTEKQPTEKTNQPEKSDAEPAEDAGEGSSEAAEKDAGSEETQPDNEETTPEPDETEGPEDTTDQESCAPGEISFVGRCMKANEYCPTRFKDQKAHLAEPYTLVEGTIFCETKDKHFYLPGTGYGACDADGDGWITIQAYRAMTYSAGEDDQNKKVQANARCTAKKIKAIVYHRDHFENKTFVQELPAETPLLETSRNDGQGPKHQLPVYTTNQAATSSATGNNCDDDSPCTSGKLCYNGHCVVGKKIEPKYINSLTKICLAGMDLNDNGIPDAVETPSLTTSPGEFQSFLSVGYHLETHYGLFQKDYKHGQDTIDVYHVYERNRAASESTTGLAVKCQNGTGKTKDYWKRCTLRDDQRCNSDGHASKGLSDCWMEKVKRAVPSLLKCVVFNPTDTKKFFYTGHYGLTKNYNRPLCSLKGEQSFKAGGDGPSVKRLQFSCSTDNGRRAPSGTTTGWACVSFQTYTTPSDYQAGCIDECTESLDETGVLPCGNKVAKSDCSLDLKSYGQATFKCSLKQQSGCFSGEQKCSSGTEETCQPIRTIQPGSVPEKCNGKDDDCDGLIDENIPSEPCYSGKTGCSYNKNTKKWSCKNPCAVGKTKCQKYTWGRITYYKTVCSGQVLPKVEVCNGKDDNCDGKIDEMSTQQKAALVASHGYNGRNCFAGKGSCRAAGTIVCSNNKWVCNAKENTSKKTGELCIKYGDEDCDGYVNDYCTGMIAGGSSGYSLTGKGTMNYPLGIAWAKDGNNEYLYVAEAGSDIIRRVQLGSHGLTVTKQIRIAGYKPSSKGSGSEGNVDGTITASKINDPGPVVVSPDNKFLYFASYRDGHIIKKIDLKEKDSNGNNTFRVSTVAGMYGKAGSTDGSGWNQVGNTPGTARLGDIWGLAINAKGNKLYFTDGKYHRVRMIDIKETNGVYTYTVSTIAGSSSGLVTGTGAEAKFNQPRGITLYKDRYLFVSEKGNKSIRRIDTAPGQNYYTRLWLQKTLRSQCIKGTRASEESSIGAVAVHKNVIYFAAADAHVLCMFSADKSGSFIKRIGSIGSSGTTVYGRLYSSIPYTPFQGPYPKFKRPWYVTVRPIGQQLTIYFTDNQNHGVQSYTEQAAP